METLIFRWPGLFLLAAAQGIFLSISILSLSQGNHKANKALAGIVFIFSLNLIYYVGYWLNVLSHLPRALAFIMQLIWLIGPFFFVYIKYATGNSLKFKNLAYHCLPLSLAIMLMSPVYFHWFTVYDWFPIYKKSVTIGIPVFQIIHLIFYFFLTRKLWKNSEYAITDQRKKGWLNLIPWFFLGFILSFGSYYLLVWFGVLRIEYDYLISASMSIFIYLTGYAGYKYPIIFTPHKIKEKYEHSNLGHHASKEIMKKVDSYLIKHEPFVNSDLKLTDLANALGVKTHHLSQVINENQKENYSDYINRYRINYAKHLMNHQQKQNLRIIDIAYDSGFNNKVSFLKAFKKFQGTTPSEYRREVKKNDSPVQPGPG